MEQARQSDTWALASPQARPWLLMLWAVAWEQVPCGSLPNDDELIAARLGIDLDQFVSMKRVLLRGWWIADDGRLYHGVMISRVLAMLEKKEKDRQRKAGWRGKKSQGVPQDSASVPRDGHVTDASVPPESHVADDTKHQAPSTNTSVPNGTGAVAAAKLTDPDEIIFGYGVPILVSAGATDKHARSFLGKVRKVHGDEAVITKLRDCIKAKPLQPLEWLAAALPPTGARASPSGGLSAAGAATLQATQSLEAKLFGEVHGAS